MRKIHEGVEYFDPNRSQFESLPAMKYHQKGLGDSEDESDAKIVCDPDFETGQQSAPLTHPARTDAKAATASLRER